MNGGDFNVHGKDQRKADFADLEGKGIKSSVLDMIILRYGCTSRFKCQGELNVDLRKKVGTKDIFRLHYKWYLKPRAQNLAVKQFKFRDQEEKK